MSHNEVGNSTIFRRYGADIARMLMAILLSFVVAQLLLAVLMAWQGVTSEAVVLPPEQLKAYFGAPSLGKNDLGSGADLYRKPQNRHLMITVNLEQQYHIVDYDVIRVAGRGLPHQQVSAVLLLSNGQQLRLPLKSDSKSSDLLFRIPERLSAPLSGLAFVFDEIHGQKFAIESVQFEPRHPVSLLHAWRTLWRKWSAPEGWRLYSVNFIKGGDVENLRSSPALAGLLWFVLAILAWWLTGLRKQYQLSASVAVAVIGLLIWTLVDLRWQIDQWRSLQFWLDASPPTDLVASDYVANLTRIDSLASQVRQLIPSDCRRLFIISPDSLVRTRLRYAMLPVNSYTTPSLYPGLRQQLRSGDYLFLVATGNQYPFDSERDLLMVSRGKHKLKVKQVIGGKGAELFRYLGAENARANP